MSTASSASSSSPYDLPPVQAVEFPPLLSISPPSFRVDVALHTDVFLDLLLTNLTPSLITFKIKTTARDRYLLKPTQDYIPPHASRTCKIVMSQLSAYPDASNPKAVKDKFLVQSAEVGVEVGDLSRYWKEREARHSVKEGRYAYAEQIVKCKLNVPVGQGVSGGQGEGGGRSPVKVGGDEREEREVRAADDVKDVNSKATAASAGGAAVNQTRMYPSLSPLNTTSSQPPPAASHSISGFGGLSASSSSAGYSRTPGETQAGDGEGRRPNEHAPDAREQKQKEYNDLMDFVVKLTAQMEREKADAAVLADKYNKALATIASQGKKIAVLQQMHAAHTPPAVASSSSSSSSSADPLGPRAPVDAANDGSKDAKDEKTAASGRSVAAAAGAGVRERLMSGEGVRNNSGGLSWQIYQILLVAIIAFLLGRILAK